MSNLISDGMNRIYRILGAEPIRKNSEAPSSAPPPPQPTGNPTTSRRIFPPSSFLLPPSKRASSLITTLLVLVVLSTIVVAFMQSMSVERTVARSVKNKVQAELAAEAALQAVSSRLAQIGSTNFIVSEDRASGSTNIRPLIFTQLNTAGNPIATNTTELGITSIGTHTFNIAPGFVRETPIYPLVNSDGQTNGAFAFAIIDNTSKQNLLRFPTITNRAFSTTLREVPLILTNQSAMTAAQTNTMNQLANTNPNWTNTIFTIDSFNQFFTDANNPGVNVAWADIDNFSPLVTAGGGKKVDLRRLKYYVDNLSVIQSNNNPKARAVEALLGLPSSVNPETSWGGGTLEWLISPANPQRYTQAEARQIVANLIDYLDSDLHPTTDNIDSPSYLGVEGRFLANGKVRGHPYITAVGHGLVFNKSGAGGSVGQLNSTRMLTYWSLVNPWSEDITGFHIAYDIELEIEILGNAVGGNIGSDPQAYFLKNLNERLNEGPSTLPANSGSTYPQNPSGMSFANFNNIRLSSAGRQPAGMRFEDIQFRILKARLRFTDTGGLTSTVQTLDNLASMPVDSQPQSFTLPSSKGATVYNPGTVRNGLFLSGDPRLNFLPSQWINAQLSSSTSATTPPSSTPPSTMFAGMDAQEGDGQQGVPGNHNWYSSYTTNHFFVRSPPELTPLVSDPTRPAAFDPTANPPEFAVDSIAEIGYLFTGRPWQTLRISNPGGTSPRTDYTLLDYIDAGTMPIEQSTAPYLARAKVNGKVNVNTAQPNTLVGVFSQLPGISQAQASTIVNSLTAFSGTNYPFLRAGDIGALSDLAKPGATTKFDREDLMRRVSNILTTRSEEFTVFCYGEARDPRNPNKKLSSSELVGGITLQVLADGTIIPQITKTHH
jgi:hypothetical protein